jgi:hypothetical protein
LFGKYIREYREKGGIRVSSKVIALATIWFTIPISAFVFVPITLIRILLFAIALLVSIHILRIKTIWLGNE